MQNQLRQLKKVLLRKSLFNCCAPLPRDSDPRTAREFLFPTLTGLPCVTLTKGSLHRVHWTHIGFPGYSFCFITCRVNCIREIKRHSGKKRKERKKNSLNVPRDLCQDTKCRKGPSECGSCLGDVWQLRYAPRTQTPGPLSHRLCHCVSRATERRRSLEKRDC